MSSKNRDIIFPEYMPQFQCIGSECEDTCCAGWFVSIDKATYKKYRTTKNPEMKKLLNDNVTRHRSNQTELAYAKIKMDDEEKCTLLDENYLCMVHKELGEEFLSNTCAMYPRTYKDVGGVIEKSATLSCPEAARLILLNKKGIEFTQDQEPSHTKGLVEKSEMTPHQQRVFWDLRIFVIQTLQYRNISIEDRIISIGLFFNRLEKLSSDGKEKQLPAIIEEFSTNIADGTLSASIQQLPTNIPFQISLGKNLIEYRSTTPLMTDRYKECLRDMISGLGLNAGISDVEVLENYQSAYKDYYQPYMKDHEYILENYLVNYVFSKLFPFDKKSLTASYSMLVINFSLVKLHLIGLAKFHEGLTDELVVKLVQSFSKAIDHNEQYLRNVSTLIKDSGYESLAHMVVLIRS